MANEFRSFINFIDETTGNSNVEDANRKSSSDLQKSLDRLFHTAEMELSTDNMLFKISKSDEFPDNNLLAKEYSETLTLHIINAELGYLNVAGYANCLKQLEAVLQKLKKAHKKYNYSAVIYSLMKSENVDSRNFTNQLSIPVLKMFFRNIFQTLIPKELFRSNKNINTVLKVITDLLEAPQYQSINLKSYMKKIRISDISWLSGVQNTDAKWCILGRLLKWFFETYILTIFGCMFYIMVTDTYEKIYFTQQSWRSMTGRFLHKMQKEKVIAYTRDLDFGMSHDGIWTLLPKKNGMRPIMANVKHIRQGVMTNIALCYLQQLYMARYGKVGKWVFCKKWRNLVDQFRDGTNKTMYLVTCDIEFAYGSIDQKKLLQIVESLTESTGPEVTLRNCEVAKDSKAIRTDSSKSVSVSKELLLRVIHHHIRHQIILLSKQKFLLQKGIAQGAILSGVLCDLYYSHMEETLMSEYKDKGFLHRYVDDFIFATENEDLARRFLSHVKNGFPEYNCSFNVAKTKTNLPGCKVKRNFVPLNHITYLGFKIDCKTLEVTPEYESSVRYTTMLSRPENDIMATFQERLLNITSLKLDGLIIDCKVNSKDIIISNVREIFMRQAERCLWLLKALFDDILSHRNEIYKIMKLSNRRIFNRIRKYFLTHGYDFKKIKPHLAVTPWTAYRRVFGKYSTIHAHFRSLFLANLKWSTQVTDLAER